jgi:DNA invertase Pin-like site-specific DNA recombinase
VIANNPQEVQPMTKAVAYIRASTDDQHLGPEAQEAALKRWAESHDVEVVSVHRDLGVSGGKPIDRRPGLQAAVAALAPADVTVLWVYDRTRFARDVMVAMTVTELVRDQGARVLTLGDAPSVMPSVDDPDFQLNQGVRDLFAAHERAKIRFRTKAALGVLKAKGKVYGRVPFGFRRACGHAADKCSKRGGDCERLVVDEREHNVLEEIQSMRADGRGLTAIANHLNRQGVRSKRGGKWYASSVKSVLETAAAAA